MSTTEQRFEVPPEYAEVYERAYRRAYEEGQNQLNGLHPEVTPRRLTGRGKRIAVPEQRSGSRRARTEVRSGGSHSSHDARVRERTQRREGK
ncbi:MAG: hypothetical protein JWO46_2626, partial [Nocardioidaceae bacterium]|nr:hypothetical protein [Nocardioidaceae bacterium]